MSQRRKFLQHFVFNGMLLWLGLMAAMISFVAIHPQMMMTAFLGGLGIVFLIVSKIRLLKDEKYTTFGYNEMKRFEKSFYLIGYFFIAASVFSAAIIYFAKRNAI